MPQKWNPTNFPLQHSKRLAENFDFTIITIIPIHMKRKTYQPPQTAVEELVTGATVLTASRESSYLDPKDLSLSEKIWD